MILRKKKIYCKDTKNELKGCHNKIEWLNFVLMQDSWQRLKSDSTSWQKTLKNSHNSQIQWPVVSTPCQETKIHLNQKVGSEGTPKLGPYWKLQPVAYKVSMEWKSELSLWTDISHSWVRISHGLNKLVTNLNNKDEDDNEQETSEMQFEEHALKLNAGDFASRSKAKAKPQRRDSASSSTRTIPIGERGTDVEPGNIRSLIIQCRRNWSIFFVMEVYLETDGAIKLWRLKDHLRNIFEHSQNLSDDMWKSKMAGGGGHKKRFQYCTASGEILDLRALQGHSGRNLIDPSLHDNVLILDDFFE